LAQLREAFPRNVADRSGISPPRRVGTGVAATRTELTAAEAAWLSSLLASNMCHSRARADIMSP